MIEPCPFCGHEVGEFYDACGLFFYKCAKCSYRIGRDGVDAHNRLSRIVRAAERLVKARKALVDAFALMDMDFPHFSVSEKARDMDFEIEQANRALTDAVEGGRADG